MPLQHAAVVVHALERKGFWGEKGNSHIFTGTGWEREMRGLFSQSAALHGEQQNTDPEELSAEPRSAFLTLSVQISTINSEQIPTKYIHRSSAIYTITYRTTCTCLNNFMRLIQSCSKILIFYGHTTVGRKSQKACEEKFLGTMK